MNKPTYIEGNITMNALWKRGLWLIALLAVFAAACGGSTDDATTSKAGFILPDSASSARWEAFDRPLIEEACAQAGLECLIQNAEGDKDNMATIADQMIADGIGVLAIVNLDSESGAAIQEKAAAAGVKNIDYDRLTLGGSADVYVSFDNVAVGTAQGEEGKKIIQLHGSPTDNNATLFRQGYQAAIADAGFVTVAEEAVPDWDNAQAGVIFEQDGLRAILQGNQCMTVYKPVVEEANGAVAAAAALLTGGDLGANATINNETGDIPYVQAQVQALFIDDVKIPTSAKASKTSAQPTASADSSPPTLSRSIPPADVR